MTEPVECELKSWEKPNAFVVCGANPDYRDRIIPIVFSFDEAGRVTGEPHELKGTGFLDNLKGNNLVLVHIVEGEEGMLVKRLATYELARAGQPVSTVRLMKEGHLFGVAESQRREYLGVVLAKRIPNRDVSSRIEQGPETQSAKQAGKESL